MFLVFTLVLLVVAIGILASVYSVFFPFMQNLWTVQQYHMAYYGAISSVERAELALRYRSPGFQGSGWFLWIDSYGPPSDTTPEILSGTDKWLLWNIWSRTTTIPSSGMGNTDPMLAASDSADYNQLWYTYLETLILGYDNPPDVSHYYSWWTYISYFNTGDITGVLRLPPKIHELFWETPWKLCDSVVGDCDPDGDGTYDDIAVSWSMEGFYQWVGFKIFPTISVFYYSGMQIDEYKDNALRESIINDTGFINFDTAHDFTFINHGANISKHNVVSAQANAIETKPFSNILSNVSNYYSWLRISFGAANLFRTFTGAIYPYLEYQFHFPQEIADRFYTIQGNGRVGEYDVQILLKKPTVQWTVGWDFTVIF